jgi:mono/diheme cytochrome c family protein
MTRNLIIATIFLLGSTLLLGFIWVREHYVLDARIDRFDGALLTRGARDYEQYCSPCHGLTGEGGVNAGAPQINNLPTTLKAQNRLDGPTGILAKYGTIRNFVEATITSGVRGTAMPRWSARLGGPLRDDQIKDIAAYIQNWWGPEGGNPNISGDAAQVASNFKQSAQATAQAVAGANTPVARGGVIFSTNCASCHNLNEKDSGVPAPGLGGLFGADGTAAFGKQLPNGKPVDVPNFLEWVKKGGAAFQAQAVNPAAGPGPYVIQAMPGFETVLKEEQLNDLLAFISSHDRSGEQKLPPLGPDGKPLPEQANAAPGTQPNTAPGNNATTPTP